MTDTQAPAQAEAQANAEAKPKAAKKNELKPCFCSRFEIGNFDPNARDEDVEIFSTGCMQQTQRMFAQGHDAKLVSFLVDGHFDGYEIRMVDGGFATTFPDPQSAAAKASAGLAEKAARATENRRTKIATAEVRKADRNEARAAKAAEKEAAKEARAAEKAAAKEAKEAAKGPKATGAEVVVGSAQGDQPPLAEGHAKIKVGRFEYDATIDAEGRASYTNGKGEASVIERDGYRVLQSA